MMQIVYFSQKKQFIEWVNSKEGERVFVTPSPKKADALRLALKDSLLTDVITIAKFTSNLVETFWGQSENAPKVKRKSELLLIFGLLKSKYYPHIKFEQFKDAYNVFSEVRSFSLDLGALESVLEEEDPEVKRIISIFWTLLNNLGFVDEHGAYEQLSAALRNHEEELSLKKTYVFWGFQHLNGQQIDLLKSLSIRYNVVIPVPNVLQDKLKRSDWISWLLDDKVEIIKLENFISELSAKWIPSNSREIAKNLKDQLGNNSQVILGISKLSEDEIEIVPYGEVRFKVSHNLIQNEIKEVFNELESFLNSPQFDLRKWLLDKKIEFIKRSDGRKFKTIKVLQQLEETLDYLNELSDERINFDSFFHKLLLEVTVLNQPRSSVAPIVVEESVIEIYDMSSLEEVSKDRPIIVAIDDRFGELQGTGQNYPEKIRRVLSSIGPLKRNDLDLYYKKWEFEDLFHETDITVLMNPELKKHSIVWKKLFEGITLNFHELNKVNKKSAGLDPLEILEHKKYQGGFSASRLQAYLDCPRKFFYSYVDQVNPNVKLIQDIDSLTSGTLVHKMIEVFIEEKKELNQVPEIVDRVFIKHIKDENLSLDNVIFNQRRVTFIHRLSNGVGFLKDIERIHGQSIKWQIEKDFKWDNPYRVLGKIDCVGISDDQIFLFDFKSTLAAASSFQEVESKESIQLWVYALAAKKEFVEFNMKTVNMGYVILDNPEDSLLLTDGGEILSAIKESKLCKIKQVDFEILAAVDEFQISLDQLVNRIHEDRMFRAIPRKDTVCSFCFLESVCNKGASNVSG